MLFWILVRLYKATVSQRTAYHIMKDQNPFILNVTRNKYVILHFVMVVNIGVLLPEG
jgi:hypothetical protein